MTLSILSLELAIVLIGLALLLADLWTPVEWKKFLGYAAAAAVAVVFIASFSMDPVAGPKQIYVLDELALFFKRFFLAAAVLVLILAVDFSDRIETGIGEFYVIILFALAGMMFAASANDFIMVFVSLELITVSFYVLVSFQRSRMASLEAGVKYLILGALASAFLVYGIALVSGVAGGTHFSLVREAAARASGNGLLVAGSMLVLTGLVFKIAAFPLQVWAPDVYQGSPAPATAFLAVGSKAAGVALLLRVVLEAIPAVVVNWTSILIVISAATILYGNLCAIPQRNLKRLLGFSSIAHAGYLLMGVIALNSAGSAAMLYYLCGYLFTVVAAFTVVAVVTRGREDEDVSAFAGLHQRAPLLAAALALAMISLAGIPPLAGFFGKFLLIRAVLEEAGSQTAYYVLLGIAIGGVVISFYYYLGIVRTIYWGAPAADGERIAVSWPMRIMITVCIGGMIYLGVLPERIVKSSSRATSGLALFQRAPETVRAISPRAAAIRVEKEKGGFP